MANPSSMNRPVTPEDVLAVQFTQIRKGGYDTMEVDAFLDRVAATLDSKSTELPAGSITADEVRSVEFRQVRRGGYNTEEVDDFLDTIVGLLNGGSDEADGMLDPRVDEEDFLEPDRIEREDDRSHLVTSNSMPPIGGNVESEVLPSESGFVASGIEPRLHDPEGAAQRLLAAAQQAADSLADAAATYDETTRREADEYCSAARIEAEENAERVISAAESHAALIREGAAEEIRRLAEDSRQDLISELTNLKSHRDSLEGHIEQLEAEVSTQRSILLETIDSLRHQIATDLADTPKSKVGGDGNIEPDKNSDSPGLDIGGDDLSITGVLSETGGLVAEVDDFGRHEDAVSLFGVATEDQLDQESVLVFDESSQNSGDETVTSSPSRMVMDDEVECDPTSKSANLNEEVYGSSSSRAPAGLGALFNIEDDPDFLDGPHTEAFPAVGAGDSFFEELRQADGGIESFGPLDDHTDAAISAFFEGDDDDDEDNGWRDRFGSNRS